MTSETIINIVFISIIIILVIGILLSATNKKIKLIGKILLGIIITILAIGIGIILLFILVFMTCVGLISGS